MKKFISIVYFKLLYLLIFINTIFISATKEFIHWELATTLSNFWAQYLRAIDTTVQYVNSQPIRRYKPELLSYIPLVAFLGSSLFSRPPHHSWWNKVIDLIKIRRCHSSDLLFLIDTVDLELDTVLYFKGPFDPPYFRRILYHNYSDLIKGPQVQLIRPIQLPQEVVENDNISDDMLSISSSNLSSISNTISIDSISEQATIMIPVIVDEIRSQLATIELSNNDTACILLTWISHHEFTQATCNAFIKAMCKDLWQRMLYIDTSQRKANTSRFLDGIDITNLGYETFCQNPNLVFKVTKTKIRIITIIFLYIPKLNKN